VNEDTYELPDGWVWKKLGEICEKAQYGWTTSANFNGRGIRLLRTSDISSGIINWDTVPFCDKEPEEPQKYLLSKGDILVSRAGSVGISIEIDECPKAIFASYLIRFRPKSCVSSRYISFYLKSPYYWNSIIDNTAGITIPNVNASKLSILEIPLPPLFEQTRIVAKIESLFARLNKTRQSLAKISPLLKKFRQSVLAKAFSGELTENWRAKQKYLEPASKLLERIRQERKKRLGKKYKESEPIDTSDLPQLPEGWEWTTFEECCLLNPRHSSDIPLNTLVSFVPMPAIDAELGAITSSETKQLEKVTKGFTHFIEGDVLFAKITPCMENGKTAIAKNLVSGIGCGTTELHVLRPLGGILSEYIYHYIRQQSFRDRAEANMTGTAGQLRVPVDFMKREILPLPPLKEQKEIMNRIQEFFSQAFAIEKSVKIAQAHCEKLTQSILAKAFRGELVEQDPNDEPAEVLLRRIKGN